MGVYDMIDLNCPLCGKEYVAQSKSGPCGMECFKLQNCPDNVLIDANRHAPFQCECGIHFEVDIEKRETIICQPRPHKDHLGTNMIIEQLEKEKKKKSREREIPKMRNDTNIKIEQITGQVLIIDDKYHIPVKNIDYWEKIMPPLDLSEIQTIKIYCGESPPIVVDLNPDDLVMKIQACGLLYEQKRMQQAMGNMMPMMEGLQNIFHGPGPV